MNGHLVPQKNIPQTLRKFAFGAFPSFWEEFEDLPTISKIENSGLTVSEDSKNVFVEASMPGLKAEEIEVTFEKGQLWIRGEKKEEEEDKEKTFYQKASSSFSYQVAVPGQIDESSTPKAIYKDGIMKVIFDKTKQTQAKKIPVKTG